LPGVGAFEDGMTGLRQKGFLGPLNAYVGKGRPLLGICLGMQLLMDKSYEFGEHEGLHLIKGEVVPAKKTGTTGVPLKIPHVGWNGLLKSKQEWDGTILEDLPPGTEMYFIHSFVAAPQDGTCILTETEYGGHRFCSVVASDNVYGCQFHPEKSATCGLKVLKNFVSLKRSTA